MTGVDRICGVCQAPAGPHDAFCISCGARIGDDARTSIGCGRCGVHNEAGTSFCINCGAALGDRAIDTAQAVVAASPPDVPTAPDWPIASGGPIDPGGPVAPDQVIAASPTPAPPRRAGRRLLIAASAMVGVAVLAVGAVVVGRALDRDGTETTGASATSPSDDDDIEFRSTDGADDGDADSGDAGDGAESGDDTNEEREQAASTTDPSSSTSSTEPGDAADDPDLGLYTGRSELYGRYVAVLWSTVTSVPRSAEDDQLVSGQLVDNRARFGDDVHALDSNDFGSLRNGTAAVVYDGGFTSALDAKRWCRSRGFPGLYDCFGVVLSDDYGPDDRGEFIRAYDL